MHSLVQITLVLDDKLIKKFTNKLILKRIEHVI